MMRDKLASPHERLVGRAFGTRMPPADRRRRGLLLGGLAIATQAAIGQSAPPPLRALVVTIVMQDDFLPWLLAGTEYSGAVAATTTHVDAVPQRLTESAFDIVIAHAHAQATRRLDARGVLTGGKIVFANSQALIGPAADPAGLAAATDFNAALVRLARAQACWVINRQGGKDRLQRAVRRGPTALECVIDDAANVGLAAVRAARERGAYTVWGLHPFVRAEVNGMRAFVPHDPSLLRPLRAWVVAQSTRTAAAQALVEHLTGAQAQAQIPAFRLRGLAEQQAWWPAVAAR
jgi:tungstate transport system substrate-binding protein